MKPRRYVAYYRVSTARQGRSGLGLEAQRQSVTGYLAGQPHTLVGEYTEVESGKRIDRPELAKALAACRIHGATMVIAKLDRLARNVEFIASLMNSGVEFVAVDMPHANRLTIHVMAAMAEHEREMISARTKAALEQAKARGVQLGGNRGNIQNIAAKGGKAAGEARRDAARRRAKDLIPLFQEIEASGARSLRAIAGRLNEMGVPYKEGCRWSASAIGRLKSVLSGNVDR